MKTSVNPQGVLISRGMETHLKGFLLISASWTTLQIELTSKEREMVENIIFSHGYG